MEVVNLVDFLGEEKCRQESCHVARPTEIIRNGKKLNNSLLMTTCFTKFMSCEPYAALYEQIRCNAFTRLSLAAMPAKTQNS